METKKIALNLSKNRIELNLYRKIQYVFQEKRVLPLFYFLRQRITKEKKERIYHSLKQKKFILYGAGEFGRAVITEMKEMHLDVISFWDGNPAKVNISINDVPIVPPIYKKTKFDNTIILITVARGSHEIEKRLDGMGYKDGLDYFSPRVWMRWIAGFWLGSL